MNTDSITWNDLIAMTKSLRKTKSDPVLLEKLEKLLVENGYQKELEEE